MSNHRVVSTFCFLFAAFSIAAGAQDGPGRLVDGGGHRIFLTCTGKGAVTVVLESGHAAPPSSVAWREVLTSLDGVTRVCHYDRAGYFKSQAGPEPRTASRIAKELHTALKSAGEAGPYLLVGHSFGGAPVRVFASAYPDEVAGVVLVEAMHEDMKTRLGEVRTREGLPDSAVFPSLQVLRQVMRDYPAADAAIAEWGSIDESLEEMRASRDSLSSVPLVVIARGKMGRYPGVPPEKMSPFEEAWRALQRDLSKASSCGSLVIAQRSGHNVPGEEPTAVVEAVRSVLRSAGAGHCVP